jgi:hypothetical protein
MQSKLPFSKTVMNKSEQLLAAKIWQAIREAKTFTLDAIADQAQLATQDIQGYVFWLRRSGYVSFTSNGFELVRNTGDRAPIATKQGFCDPNVT